MFLRIQRGSAVPISRQLMEQLRAQCLSGALRPGAVLPSVRQLACELAVNVNTVHRVYERLAAEGVLEMRQGEGTFVATTRSSAPNGEQLKKQRRQFAVEFASLAQRGLLWGLSAEELKQMVANAAHDVQKTQMKGRQND